MTAEPARAGQGRDAASGDRAQAIYRRIFDAVVEQRLPPGAKLPEEQLGALFDASRTLVRSALQALAHDHIVTIERHRGAFVSAPSTAEAQDIFHSRRLVEAGVALEVADRIAPADVERLQSVLDDEERALAAGDRQAAIRLSGEFHLTIARIRGDGALTKFLASLISRSSLVIALYGRGPASACGHADHVEVARALAERDGPRAARLMARHLDLILTDLALAPRAETPIDLATILRGPNVKESSQGGGIAQP